MVEINCSSSIDIAVVGAGFAGLYALYRLRRSGFRVRVFERGDGVGGTWFWNRYPGARCDVESLQYSFSFSPELQEEWEWSERYAAQPEILAYLEHVADRFNLRSDIALDTEVVAARRDGDDDLWIVETDRGEIFHARYVILATGCLSAARIPDIDGLETFEGRVLHTGRWPKDEVDFSGRRVAVVGTGSSGIQVVPKIAETARHLTVFQRTPNFSIPAWNRPLEVDAQREWKARYDDHRARARNTRSGILYDYATRGSFEVDDTERLAEFDRRWARGGANFTHCFNDIFLDRAANDLASDYVREKIRITVTDPEKARLLAPRDHPIGTKRICVDTDYYETYNRKNVDLVDLRATPIAAIEPSGVRAGEVLHAVDDIVFATGYDAVTGAIARIDIRNGDDEPLKDKWNEGPKTYLGLMVAGFPNLFTITGPGSPSILTNVVVSIEQHVEWIGQCLDDLAARGATRIEATETAEADWVEKVREAAAPTLFTKTASWYMGANIPGKPPVFLPYVGGFQNYSAICQDVAERDYAGFEIT